jgi:hypothetical protein
MEEASKSALDPVDNLTPLSMLQAFWSVEVAERIWNPSRVKYIRYPPAMGTTACVAAELTKTTFSSVNAGAARAWDLAFRPKADAHTARKSFFR